MTISYLFIDSNNRESQFSNSYTVYLTRDLRNIKQVDLVQASVPNVVTNISNGTDVIRYDDLVNYSIPAGFYNSFELADVLSNVLPVQCQYHIEQGLFMFSNLSTSFSLQFNTSEIRKCLGISSDEILNSINPNTTPFPTNAAAIVLSDQIADMSTSQSVFLDIDELRNDTLIDTKSKSNFPGTTVSRFFAPIPMDVQPGYLKTFSENRDFSYSIHFDTALPRLSRLTIRWTDADGQILNFKGYERNSFLLRVHTADRLADEQYEGGNKTQMIVLGIILFLIFLLVSF